MTQSWNDLEEQDLWTLSADEVELLPGMTNMGRLGFAVQLKFMQIHARFPEHHTEVGSRVVRWLSRQVGASEEMLQTVRYRIYPRTPTPPARNSQQYGGHVLLAASTATDRFAG